MFNVCICANSSFPPQDCRRATCKTFTCNLGLLQVGSTVEVQITTRLWQSTLVKVCKAGFVASRHATSPHIRHVTIITSRNITSRNITPHDVTSRSSRHATQVTQHHPTLHLRHVTIITSLIVRIDDFHSLSFLLICTKQ